MPLTFVKPAEQPTVNILLYGPPKTGKTTGACSAPGGVLLMNADLPNASVFAHSRDPEGRIQEISLASPMETLIEVTNAIEQQGDGDDRFFDTVVVDPISELQRRMLEEASDRAVHPSLNQYLTAQTYLERFCRMLCEAPVNCVIVCHELPIKDEGSGTIERLPNTGTSNPSLGQKLMGMVDIVGYTAVLVQEGDHKEYVAQLINDRGRRGGDRFDVLGDWRTLDLAEWFALIHGQTPDLKAAA